MLVRIGTAFIIHAMPISYFVALAVFKMTKCVTNKKKATANVAMANFCQSAQKVLLALQRWCSFWQFAQVFPAKWAGAIACFCAIRKNKQIHILPLLHWEQTAETERKWLQRWSAGLTVLVYLLWKKSKIDLFEWKMLQILQGIYQIMKNFLLLSYLFVGSHGLWHNLWWIARNY